MKHDINSSQDIFRLVTEFYIKAKSDETIGDYFTQDRIDWDVHIPKMCTFWENILFFSGNYSGNPMEQHQLLHQSYPFDPKDFDRWLKIFVETVNQLFQGQNADLIKQRAKGITKIMAAKLFEQ